MAAISGDMTAPPGLSGARGASRHATARPARMAATSRAGLFAWVPVCLAAGIALWFALPVAPDRWHWITAGALAGLCLAIGRMALPWAERGRIGWSLADALRTGATGLLLVVAGFGLIGMRSALVAAPVMEWRYYGPVEGRVVEIDRSARDRIRLTLDRVVLHDTAPDRTPAKVRLSLMDNTDPLPPLGQRVMLTGHLGPPPAPASPGSFDFRWLAWFEGLGGVGYTRTPIMTVEPAQGGIWAMHRARMAVSQAIRDGIGGQEGAVASALMTGDRSGIAEATNEVMRASNLYHIISISGLHMSMLAGFVYTALRMALVLGQGLGAPLPQGVHKVAALGALLASAAYLWLSGGGVATERAFVMVAVMLLAIMADRRAISLRTIALAATIILIYSPEAVTQPGFQMSFAATVALILSAGPWSRVSPHVPFWLRPVAMLLVSSLVASIATSPLAAAHFNRMAQYGLLANLLVVPVMGALVMPAGVIGALLAPVGLAGPALWVMGLGTKWMLWVAEWIAGLGGSVTALPLPPGPVIPLMCFGATLAVLCWGGGLRIRRLGPGALGFLAGVAMLVASAAIWITADRPLLLIAPEGEAVGLMTPQGRAASKPSGGAFIIGTWLQEDGDIASQEESAARPAWGGDRRDRMASLPGGWQVWHFTGKGAADRAPAACRPQRIVVVSEKLPTGAEWTCVMLDLGRLRKTGAVVVGMGADGPVLHGVNDLLRSPG
ncbi:ComEC family competence protein [Paracoccus sediminis]|uniref:ComEC family competence protein n=1 Tax=Paracoccus sediminis TaxID=1214787 RepID=A0A238X688_9RHOB|nr:ComEC/Rec2 family competence protein [Paracoccus sediminis]TBN49051.1 ComEC family competence protein [Paracoccus sediminis]SNR53854.1 competence protein ComEC [Paracoccus sediminis]